MIIIIYLIKAPLFTLFFLSISRRPWHSRNNVCAFLYVKFSPDYDISCKFMFYFINFYFLSEIVCLSVYVLAACSYLFSFMFHECRRALHSFVFALVNQVDSFGIRPRVPAYLLFPSIHFLFFQLFTIHSISKSKDFSIAFCNIMYTNKENTNINQIIYLILGCA